MSSPCRSSERNVPGRGVFRTFSFDRGPADGPAVFDPADVGIEDETVPPVQAEPQVDGRDTASEDLEDPAPSDEDDYGMED